MILTFDEQEIVELIFTNFLEEDDLTLLDMTFKFVNGKLLVTAILEDEDNLDETSRNKPA